MSLSESGASEVEEDVAAWYKQLHRPRPLLVVISGPSGVGKDVTIQRLKKKDYPCHFVVTATTREKRESEVDGVDYHFVSIQQFESMVQSGELLEHALVYNQYKGIPKSEVQAALASGVDAILRIDVQGAATIRSLVPEAITIFLTAESDEALVNRLQHRLTENAEEMERRIRDARMELREAEKFDYVVINRECLLDDTVEQVISIMRAEKCRQDWKPATL